MNDVRPSNVRWNLVKELRKIDWIISIELIAIVIGVLIICLVLVLPHYLAPILREEEPPHSLPFEINAVSHEITNLSDMYTGFEFDNSTFTVKVDITNDTIYIRGIQQEYGPRVSLKINNITISENWQTSSSYYPAYLYIRWSRINVYYDDNMTFSFSGKGRAIAVDNW